jgi:hypothetical protein
MEDVNISKFRAQVVRAGSTPASPGFVVSEGQNPVNPSGSGQNHLPVTIGSPANGLAVTDAQILTIDKAQIFAGTSSQFVKGDGTLDSTAYGTGSVTSVALTMPAAFSVAGSPITTAGTLAVTATGTTSQYIRGDGSLATFPGLTGFVPYTGATADVNLGTHDLAAERGTFANNGSSDTLTVNHTSGSGYGIIVTKGGNNEALYVSKTSGSGNAMTVVGGRTSLVDLALSSVTNTAGDFLTLSGGVVHKRTAAQTLTDIGGQAALTNPVTGTGTSGTIPVFTGSTTIGNSIISSSASFVSVTSNTDGQILRIARTSGAYVWSLGMDSTSVFYIYNNAGTPVFEINSSTSNAKFVSNLTANSIIRNGGTSTEYLMADGSVSTLTNPVTGTGTIGQVAYFSGTTTISSESNLFWDSTNDRLGIGTNSPSARLTVTTPTTGVEAENIRLEMNTSAVPSSAGLNFRFGSVNGATIYGVGENGSTGASSIRFYTHNGTSSAERMRISTSSNLLIATLTDSGERLQVRNGLSLFELASGTNGAILKLGRSAGSYYWHLGISGATSNFEFYDNNLNVLANINVSTGAYTAVSDKNKKKDFEPSILGLNEIVNLKPTLYRMINDSNNTKKHLGFIAQEVKDFIPQAYVESEDFIGLNYNSIIPVLVNAIKELKQEIDTLKN